MTTERMITFDDIRGYRALTIRLYALQEEREVIFNVVHSPSGRQSIGEAKGNSVSDPTANAVRKLLDLEERIAIQLDEVAEKSVRIHAFLDSLPDQEVAEMCRLHYVAGLPWRMVAIRTYYSDESSCRKRVYRYFNIYD